MPVPTTPRYGAGVGLRLSRRRGTRSPHHDLPGQITANVVSHVLATFNLAARGPAHEIPGKSRSNNVIVETAEGTKVLKRYKSSVSEAMIVHEHSVLKHLAMQGFPAARLSPTGGATMTNHGGRWYALFDYLPGYFHFHEYFWLPQRRQDFVTLSGRALGALHRAVYGFTPTGVNPYGFESLAGTRWRDVEWYLDLLERSRRSASHEHREEPDLLTPMIREHGSMVNHELLSLDSVLSSADLHRQVIHGDYGPYNLLFKPGERITIIDFEMTRIDWLVVDLAKSYQHFGMNRFGIQPARISSFLAGYEAMIPLDRDDVRLIPSVWRFLTLRRVVVYWDRYSETGQLRWLREAQRKLDLAEAITGATDMLTRLGEPR